MLNILKCGSRFRSASIPWGFDVLDLDTAGQPSYAPKSGFVHFPVGG